MVAQECAKILWQFNLFWSLGFDNPLPNNDLFLMSGISWNWQKMTWGKIGSEHKSIRISIQSTGFVGCLRKRSMPRAIPINFGQTPICQCLWIAHDWRRKPSCSSPGAKRRCICVATHFRKHGLASRWRVPTLYFIIHDTVSWYFETWQW